VVVKEKKGERTVRVTKTELLASSKLSLKINKSKTIDLKLSKLGKTAFAYARSHADSRRRSFRYAHRSR
jgi:hypothetical protein